MDPPRGLPEAEDTRLEVGSPERLAKVRESVDNRPLPTEETHYALEEPFFWNTRYLPMGSVMVYVEEGSKPEDKNEVALRVEEVLFEAEGAWVKVKFLGCVLESRRRALQAFFRKGAKEVHLCVRDRKGICPQGEEPGLHLSSFAWHPAGSFSAPWLGRTGEKHILEGVRMAANEKNKGHEKEAAPRGSGAAGTEKGATTAEKLDQLRARLSKRQSAFARKEDAPPSKPQREPARVTFGDGTSAPAREGLLVARSPTPVPVIDLKAEERESKKRKASVSSSLAQAVAMRQEEEDKKKTKEKTRRSRSKSRGSKSHKKKKKDKGSSDEPPSGEEDDEDSDSSSSLVPPLKKKAMRDPGSVFKMLESQARDQLAQDGVVSNSSNQLAATRACLYTYYQLVLKPEMDPRSRDSKEVSLLARTLDLLKEGRFPQVADLLAARLIAVTTAVKQGWGTARHLEVHQPEDDAVAPPHILLAAQRHARQVEKAGGKGSWGRTNNWNWDSWHADPKPKGKGKEQKGKGKKGKGKPKNKGGGWNNWGGDPKEKGGEATAKADS